MSIRSGICIVAVCVLCLKTISVRASNIHRIRRTAGSGIDPQNESEYHLRHENVGKRSTSENEQHKDIEYRLTKLEVQVEDKAKLLKDLEHKTMDLQSGLNEIKTRVGRKDVSIPRVNERLELSEDSKMLKDLQQNISMLSQTTHLGLGILELLRRDITAVSKDTSLLLKQLGYQSHQTNLEDSTLEEQTNAPNSQTQASRVPKMLQGEDMVNNAEKTRILQQLKQQVSSLLESSYSTLDTLEDIREDISNIRKDMSFILERQRNVPVSDINVQSSRDNSSVPQIPAGLFEVPTSSLSSIPKNCKELREQGGMTTGIYQIQPGKFSFPVVCDMETQNGGWTYVLNRYDGSQDFFRGYIDYKTGFGNLAGEFWIGLDHIYELTRLDINELYVELVDANGEKTFAHYDSFGIGNELEGYMLKILGGYSGTAGDSLTYHAGNRFSTKDLDQDGWVEGNCAIAHSGAWWYKSCDKSNLNGRYILGDIPDPQIYQGIYWDTFKGPQHGLVQVRMMIRPRPMNSHSSFTGRFEN